VEDVQTFYYRATQPMLSTIDVVAGGTLMNKMKDKASNLIEEMELNNYQSSNKRGQLKRIGDKLEVNAFTLLSAKADVMTQSLEHLNINAVNTNFPFPPCEICGFIDYLTIN